MAKKPIYLVTGAGGFAGGHMVELLLSHGHRVRATDLQDEPPAFFPPEVEYVQADLTQPSTLEKVCDGVGIVFHPASIFDFSTPREIMERVNVGGTENLCEAASQAGVKRMVLWSTMMIFGEEGHRDKPITEDSPRISDSIYASSKIRQEDVALRYSQEGKLPVTVVRPAIIYGPRSVYGLADIFIKARRLPIIPVVPNYKDRLCLIHVHDVVGAAYYLSTMKETVGECYNLADDYSDLPIRDLLTLAALILEKPVLTLPIPLVVVRWSLKALADLTSAYDWMKVEGRPIMEQDFVHLLRMDGYATNTKLKSTGYRLKYPDWRIGLLETAQWYREREMW
jgi:UDP-glucose 4-epimerase